MLLIILLLFSLTTITLFFRKYADDCNWLLMPHDEQLLAFYGSTNLVAALSLSWISIENENIWLFANCSPILKIITELAITYLALTGYFSIFDDLAEKYNRRISTTENGPVDNRREHAIISRRSDGVDMITVKNVKRGCILVHGVVSHDSVTDLDPTRYRLLLSSFCKFLDNSFDGVNWICEVQLKSVRLLTGEINPVSKFRIAYPRMSYIHIHKCLSYENRFFVLYTVQAFGLHWSPAQTKITEAVCMENAEEIPPCLVNYYSLPAPQCLRRSWNGHLFKRYFLTWTPSTDGRMVICMKKSLLVNNDQIFVFEYSKNRVENRFEIRRELEISLNFDRPCCQYKNVVYFLDAPNLVLFDLFTFAVQKFKLSNLADHVTLPSGFSGELFSNTELMMPSDFRIYRRKIIPDRLKRISAEKITRQVDVSNFSTAQLINFGVPTCFVGEVRSKSHKNVKLEKRNICRNSVVLSLFVTLLSSLFGRY